MDTHAFNDIIRVIRAEEHLREEYLTDQHPDVAYDHRLFVDKPFVTELCLMLLVRLSHQVERELLLLAERMPKDKREKINAATYRANVIGKRKWLLKERGRGWAKLYDELGVVGGEPKPLVVLRYLANSYKHDPFMLPDPQLLGLLNLPKKRELFGRKPPSCANHESDIFYAPFSESCLLQRGLADLFHLGENADYCDIAEQFVEFASTFLVGLKNGVMVPFEQQLVSMNPDDFEH
jgi:hypothetical protein